MSKISEELREIKRRKEWKEDEILLFNNLMHGPREYVRDAFCMMAKKHYKRWTHMVLEFYCQAMQKDDCKTCKSREDCCESKFNLNGE